MCVNSHAWELLAPLDVLMRPISIFYLFIYFLYSQVCDEGGHNQTRLTL